MTHANGGWMKGLLARSIAALVLGLVLLAQAQAANKPCSGKKGGVSHCQGGKFVCNDGSLSASKKTCTGHRKKK